MLWIAITPYVKPDSTLVEQIIRQSTIADRILLRLDVTHEILDGFVSTLLEYIPKDKLIIHSDTQIVLKYGLSYIHFKDNDTSAFAFKKKHPKIIVSMSVHSAQSCETAKQKGLDFGFYSHLFATPSKPGQRPRTSDEVQQALNTELPLIALGGIDESTLSLVPRGFIGIAAIRFFQNDSIFLKRLREECSLRNTTS